MPLAKAKTKFVRVSPRKARLVADLIRLRPVEDAMVQLSYAKPKAAKLLSKTLRSAVANAEENLNENVTRKDLFISKIQVDGGPTRKHAWSKSKGRRAIIVRQTSHFLIELDRVRGN